MSGSGEAPALERRGWRGRERHMYNHTRLFLTGEKPLRKPLICAAHAEACACLDSYSLALCKDHCPWSPSAPPLWCRFFREMNKDAAPLEVCCADYCCAKQTNKHFSLGSSSEADSRNDATKFHVKRLVAVALTSTSNLMYIDHYMTLHEPKR